jgi:hypothetical protein
VDGGEGIAPVAAGGGARVGRAEAVVADDAGQPDAADDGDDVADRLQRVGMADEEHVGRAVGVAALALGGAADGERGARVDVARRAEAAGDDER